ncbi:MAG: GNAT family N-acetyltransferase [Candidatus Lokiarchaeota archaeon]|nr:GNAT family N-acetyltransferase [Candidatus Lokiarchaeota archaeon]
MTVVFRVANSDDKDKNAIADLLKYVYDESPPAIEHFKALYELIYKEWHVGIIRDKIVTCLRSIPLNQNIRGTFKKMAGVGMVGTYPEHRRKGYCRDLMICAFEKMKNDGILVSTLTPFKDSFYMKFNYVNAKPHQFIELNPSWLERWKILPEGYSLKRMQISEGVRELRELQEYTVSQFNGGVKLFDDRWKEFTEGNPAWLVLVYNAQKKVEGAMYYSMKGYGNRIFGEDNIGRMGRIGFFPKTLEAKHALFHFIYLHTEQLVQAMLPLFPHEDNFQSWIQGHIKTDIKQHFISMVRIVNVETVFDGISVPEFEKRELCIEVKDPMCEWNNGILKLREEGGQLHSTFYPNESADTKITIEGLTALLYGTVDVGEIEYFGWLENLCNEDKETLLFWFPKIEYCCTEFF